MPNFTERDVDISTRLQELFGRHHFNIRDEETGEYKPIDELVKFAVNSFSKEQMKELAEILT